MASDSAAMRSILTPEGVPVEVELADRGARAGALLIDLVIIVASLVLVGVLLVLLSPIVGTTAVALLFVVSFFLRCPYFMAFELRWQGQTPGKRVFKLRVVDRRGGALSPKAVAARNVMREIEVFMPATLLLFTPDDISGMGTLLFLSALTWLGIFTLMPMFNRDRLRLGDMIAGTWVVRAQPVTLERDLTTISLSRRYRFTDAQLGVYGIAELQVLERLLRQPNMQTTLKAKKDVLDRIGRKIGWADREAVDTEIFLNDYYGALRAQLEQRALFGERLADKHAAAARRDGT